MASILDYLAWRGDILFSQLGLNEVDAMILSELAYISYDGLVADSLQVSVPLRTVVKTILALPDPAARCHVEKDFELLQAIAESERFGTAGVTFYRNVLIPEEETQFAAITFQLEDGTAFLAFRGTDYSLVGWKEDFNMAYQKSVPAQRLAQEYVQRYAATSNLPLRLGGHSKGGNLAIYAGAKCGSLIQERILDVYNFDGPGFALEMLSNPGYMEIIPKIRTLVPQFSVIGMIMERSEKERVVQSDASGLLQHDPYSWQVMGKAFVGLESVTDGSLFLVRTLTTWLDGLSMEERSAFIDGIFDLLTQENASQAKDLLRPQNIIAVLKAIRMDEEKRRMMGTRLQELLETAKTMQLKPTITKTESR